MNLDQTNIKHRTLLVKLRPKVSSLQDKKEKARLQELIWTQVHARKSVHAYTRPYDTGYSRVIPTYT